jgi:hypothetical protein
MRLCLRSRCACCLPAPGLVYNPIFYIICAAGAYTTGSRLLGYDSMPTAYYDIPLRTKVGISGAYVALIAVLLFSMNANNKRRKTPRQLKAEQSGVFMPDSHWRVQSGNDGVFDDFFSDDSGSNDPHSR